MTWILTAHLVAALLAVPLVRAIGRSAFHILALVPAGSVVWLAAQVPHVLEGPPREERLPWIPSLGIELALRLDVLSWVLAMLATGIGALVLAYCARYFKDTEPGLGRFAAVLTAFAGAMVGLVLTDDAMMLFVFWELTTVFSYLLISHYAEKQASRRAALNALIATVAGGLAMFVGLLMLAVRAGSMSITAILADDMWTAPGPYLITAMALVLAGAFSKSAQLPSHFWLPGAMAAPTPVSAYLHAAAMVKAGVYLLLRFTPGLAHLEALAMVTAAVGAATMLVGGWRALRQTDIKLLLAYGTVSQLGFLTAMAGLGTRSAALAALAMTIAHALFKAPLFMVVGIIDKKLGTRDLRVLSRVGRATPTVAVIGIVAAASMAAVPPLLGFIAKEGIYASLWGAGGWHRLLLIALIAGSVLTVAYSWRFVRGAFGPAPGAPDADAVTVSPLAWGPPAVIVAASLLLIGVAEPVERLLRGYADALPAAGDPIHLTAIPHPSIPLALSALTLTLGILLCLAARPVERFQRAVSPQTWGEDGAAEWLDAERLFRRSLRGLDALAVAVTPVFQRGSLPFTLGSMLMVMTLMAAAPMLGANIPLRLLPAHHWAEPLLLALAVAATIGAVRARRRLRAVLLVSLTGYTAALYFALWGIPDVATTQVLVETILTVVLVLVLRRLPRYFSRRPMQADKWPRIIVAVGTAVVLTSAALLAASARTATPTGPALIEPAYSVGGGHNVINVVLVDTRVWDTMGEVSVLVVAATGVASLIFITRREQTIVRVADLQEEQRIWRRRTDESLPQNVLEFDVRHDDVEDGNRWRTWLSAGRTLAPERRLVVMEVITRFLFPLIMLFSVYLLMAGHNHPGGGFAGGLTAGLGLALRYLAGGRYELSEAAPYQAGRVLGVGLAIVALSAVLPVVWGMGIFGQITPVVHVPVLGELHFPSALVMDTGVYLIVLGVVLDFLRTLGSQIDRQQEAGSDAR